MEVPVHRARSSWMALLLLAAACGGGGSSRGDTGPRDSDGDRITDADEGAPDRNTDGDATPDYLDLDSDDDGISDQAEAGDADLGTAPANTDGDPLPDYLDTDSDGDGIADTSEAGDADPATAPVDSEGDGTPDFLDPDSDDDGLADAVEDPDGDGVVDPGETSAVLGDTDGDGLTDLVEIAAGTDPGDPTSTPEAQGDLVFVLPYQGAEPSGSKTFDFSTDIARADVFFSMDVTGSMSGEVANLRSALSTTIIPGLAASIPDVALGVGWYADFPTEPFGGSADQPFRLLHRIMSVSTADGMASVQGAVNALPALYGNDASESGWEAMHQIATGAGTTVGGASVAPFDPAVAAPASIPAGETTGAIGGVGFRAGAMPIVVAVTDAASHDAAEYSFAGAASRAAAIGELQALSARVIGVVSSSGGTARADLNQAVQATGSVVPPTAWDPDRPAGCAAGQCCTGVNGAGEASVDGSCPLSFVVSDTGAGLGSAVVTGISVLTDYATLDVGASIADDTVGDETVDAVASFVDHLAANPAAPEPCVQGLTAADAVAGDGVLDTFLDVRPGRRTCFDVVPKANTTVPARPTAQLFQATITVVGDGVTALDTRRVFFLVPAAH